jgi:hypothetical protein
MPSCFTGGKFESSTRNKGRKYQQRCYSGLTDHILCSQALEQPDSILESDACIEGCSAIWRTSTVKEVVALALRLTPESVMGKGVGFKRETSHNFSMRWHVGNLCASHRMYSRERGFSISDPPREVIPFRWGLLLFIWSVFASKSHRTAVLIRISFVLVGSLVDLRG